MMRPMIWLAAMAWMVGATLGLNTARCQEIQILPEDKQQMDSFEAHSLQKADKSFDAKQYRAAAAEYSSFLLEFPQSRVAAYVLFRHARAIDLDNKKFQAVKKYQEVLDYYPNATHYAAAALYYIGKAYWDAGDPEKAVKAWVEMAQDKDYSRHALAAPALNALALNYIRQKNWDLAMKYYEQVVVDFRTANPAAAQDAMAKVIEFRMLTQPDEAKLRAFYIKARGFGQAPATPEPDLEKSRTYWGFIADQVKKFGDQFKPEQNQDKIKFYRYWAGVMSGKFPEWDAFQIDLAAFQLVYENDPAKWIKRLDAQFDKYQKPDDFERVIRWMGLFKGNKSKLDEYYAKLDFAKMNAAAKEQLMFTLLEFREYAMAKNVFDKLPLDKMPDKDKAAMAGRLATAITPDFPLDLVVRLCDSFADADQGRLTLLRFYYTIKDHKDGIPLAEKLVSVPALAKEATLKLADMLFWKGAYQEAIAQYQAADSPPATLYSIVECYLKMRQRDLAVGQLQEIENYFVKEAPKAALQIAYIYRDAGDKTRYIGCLRQVLKKYPGSPQSSRAHLDLEKLGVKMGGGVDADE